MSDNPTRTLRLTFHGRIIDHLGIQMYQSPVAAVAELIANAWDADAENVWIELPESLSEDAELVVRDDGLGMTFEECQKWYLNVGWCRREALDRDKSLEKERPVLGRKGIGKFSGFGIAEVIRIETISKRTGEKTVFELDINDLRSDTYVVAEGREISVLDYLEPDDQRREEHGTTVFLKRLKMGRRPSPPQFARSIARRFLLHQRAHDFRVLINNAPLPEEEDLEGVEFVFPQDYREGEKPEGLLIDNGWGVEITSNGREIRWRVFFYKEPIEEEELRGIAVFSKGKLAQRPFFFNLSGGLGGQHGQEYMSGQVEAEYIDALDEDIIATERQRINWEHRETVPLEEWGQTQIKKLLNIWRTRRGERRHQEMEQKVATFSDRLERLPSYERRTVKKALTKLGAIPTLSDEQFQSLGEAILQSWEQGRLRGLIDHVSTTEDLDEHELLSILVEAQVLTALNVAEAVKTKLLTVGGLKVRIQRCELETDVRDYIAKNPWLISPEWETFQVEKSVRKLTEDTAGKAGLSGEDWDGRVDLTLASGNNLLILEFMRPGLRLDWDHIDRFERYVRMIRTKIAANTGGRFQHVTGYIVADSLAKDIAIADKIKDLQQNGMYALDWSTLFRNACAGWQEFLEILVCRAPEDERLKALL